MEFVYIGPKTNVSFSWFEAASIFGFHLTQVCSKGYEVAEESSFFDIERDLEKVLKYADLVLTDTILNDEGYLERFQLNDLRIALLKEDALFNPTPPFYRGEVINMNDAWKKKFILILHRWHSLGKLFLNSMCLYFPSILHNLYFF